MVGKAGKVSALTGLTHLLWLSGKLLFILQNPVQLSLPPEGSFPPCTFPQPCLAHCGTGASHVVFLNLSGGVVDKKGSMTSLELIPSAEEGPALPGPQVRKGNRNALSKAAALHGGFRQTCPDCRGLGLSLQPLSGLLPPIPSETEA